MEINELAAIDATAGQEASARLVLKATPPRIQRDQLSRPRLLLGAGRFGGLGPAQQQALAAGGLAIAFGLPLVLLGQRPA